jgi:hypothetical protein
MRTLLFDPFQRYSEKKILLFGIPITFFGSFLGWYFNARFDGVIDLHFVKSIFPFQPFFDNLIALFCLNLVLIGLGKYFNPKTRIVDVVAATTIARTPIYLLTIFNVNNSIFNISQRLLLATQAQKIEVIAIADLVIILFFATVSMAAIAWFFIILWNGFKTATNAKGIQKIVVFVIAVIIAEIINKVLIYLF